MASEGWTDYAQFSSSKGDQTWKVQLNTKTLLFRCSCPSYIWSRASPKVCKHCNRCKEDQAIYVPSVNSESILKLEAIKIVEAMVRAAGLDVSTSQREKMRVILSSRLASFSPVSQQSDSIVPTRGVRHITLDDD